ncbi:MAG TPA: sigma-70 family RNA polymerase sigma factor [Candidatus Polarisedimenticolaceae bacterium]|nr:sigma-70 family RNA polymerase sigma factor [Candidatus Polarisedimenticolaceae bacterium]
MAAVKYRRRIDAAGDDPYDAEAWRGLFRAIAGGRVEALERLYDLAAGRVYGLAAWRLGSAEDAADVTHDVFVRVAESADRLREVDDPRAWLLAVTHRLAVDHARRRRRHRTTPLEDHVFFEVDVSHRVERIAVTAVLARLPDKQREAIFLHHFAGCTFAEVGRITGVPTFTAASRYRLGLNKLRAILEGES